MRIYRILSRTAHVPLPLKNARITEEGSCYCPFVLSLSWKVGSHDTLFHPKTDTRTTFTVPCTSNDAVMWSTFPKRVVQRRKQSGYIYIRRHILLSTAKTISNALISSRLDYCNSLINNIAKQDLSKLQRVQNCLARVILRAPRFSPSLPLLKQLHWLPVNYRIKFKLCTLTFRALAIHQPPYLASILHFSNIPRQRRSSTSQQLSIPRTKLNLGKRAFSVAAPIIWNELPTTLKSCESLASFRKNLKTYLFKIAFPP